MTARAVVAATDGSGEATCAVEWAAREAARYSVPLRIVSAATLPRVVMLQLRPERDAALGFVREYYDRALAAAAARATEVVPGLVISTHRAEGQAARVVTESGSGALMLVVGHRGVGAVTALALGSVAGYACAHASCPVVVVRAQDAVSGLVGVGVGDLDDDVDALEFAFTEAALRQARLTVIHAWHGPQGSVWWADGRYPPPGLHAAAAAARRKLTLTLEAWREKYPEVTVNGALVHGHPGRALADLSAHADLVVIGRHGWSGVLPAAGSAQHSALRRARGPIAVVPSRVSSNGRALADRP